MPARNKRLGEWLQSRFTAQTARTPQGRAYILYQAADAESNGENGIFKHVLAHVEDPELRKMIEKHSADELRHAALFTARAEANVPGGGSVPDDVKIIDRLDRATGGFMESPIVDERGVMAAYLLLQVIEERGIAQFKMLERAFRPHDPESADTFLAVLKDEERHLKYCHAISRRYAPDEATRIATLDRYRELEASCFEDNGRANMQHILGRGLMPQGATLWRLLGSVLDWLRTHSRPLAAQPA